MNLTELQKRASAEVDIPKWTDIRNKIAFQYPKGNTFSMPSSVIPVMEEYFDNNNLPFYHIGDTCVATALTYSQLYDYCRII